MQRLSLVSILCIFGSACGGTTESGGLTVNFTVSRGGAPLACADATEVLAVEVRLRDAEGAPVAGTMRQAECDSGTWFAAVPDGDYELQVIAKGTLSGDDSAVLFKSPNTPMTAPGSFDVVLEPQVAYLTLGWTFGEAELGPCGTEVETIDVIVSAGAGQVGSFNKTLGCAETPIVIPQPLDLQRYLISVTANSPEGFPLFNDTAERLLDRGKNEYTANLMPQGGQVVVDWDFVVAAGDMPVRACDAGSVGVTEAVVTIASLEGGASVSETVACTDRPHGIRAARFTPGRRLSLTVEAQGAERFLVTESFTMPAGDYVGERLILHAVGTATVGIEVATATCTPGSYNGVDFTLTLVEDAEQTQMGEVGPYDAWVLNDLWYGTYELEVALRTPQGPLCARVETRTITEGSTDWGVVRF